ncbi:Zinc finger BED domain-containing protein RICESLEEPER 1 [Bienertia sinuspersici]
MLNANSPAIVMDEDDDAPSNTQGEAINSQGRKLTSFVWQHMEREVLPDGSIQATCNHCKSNFCASSNSGTSHPKRHIVKCPKRMNCDIRNYCLSNAQTSATTKKLQGDNFIRWNSTFVMLDCFIHFWDVIDHVVSRDKHLKLFSLTKDEWDRTLEVHAFFKVFYDVMNQFSTCKNPTTNLYFDGVWRMHKKLIEVADDQFSNLSFMAKDMQVIFDKYWYEFNVNLSCVVVLDPRFKLERVEYCYENLYGEIYAKEMISKIRITLLNLFDEYKGVVVNTTSPIIASSSGFNNLLQAFLTMEIALLMKMMRKRKKL